MGRSYRDLLHESWDDLPPGVRLTLSPPVRASGTLKIHVAQRGVAGLIACLIQLPTPGESVASSLDVVEGMDGIEWIRKFDSMRAVSVQRIQGDHISEAAPPFELELVMSAAEQTVEVKQTGLRLFGLAVPLFLGPLVSATIAGGPDERSWRVSVSIAHVWFGLISAYEGVMRAQ